VSAVEMGVIAERKEVIEGILNLKGDFEFGKKTN
jgi:hypothetical protein